MACPAGTCHRPCMRERQGQVGVCCVRPCVGIARACAQGLARRWAAGIPSSPVHMHGKTIGKSVGRRIGPCVAEKSGKLTCVQGGIRFACARRKVNRFGREPRQRSMYLCVGEERVQNPPVPCPRGCPCVWRKGRCQDDLRQQADESPYAWRKVDAGAPVLALMG